MSLAAPPNASADADQLQREPGVRVERRCFLTLTAAALGSALAPRSALAKLKPEDDGKLGLEEFLDAVVPQARRLVADASARGQDVYLHTLAAHALRLAEVPLPELRPSSQGEGVSIGVNPGGDPFVVLHWTMEPGSRIRPHAHTYGNVVTLALEGEAVVRNFELVGERRFAADEEVELRLTREQRLTPGRVNLVNLEHDYIHGFEAGPRGARGLDITTRIRDKQPTPYFEIEGQGEGSGTYKGRCIVD